MCRTRNGFKHLPNNHQNKVGILAIPVVEFIEKEKGSVYDNDYNIFLQGDMLVIDPVRVDDNRAIYTCVVFGEHFSINSKVVTLRPKCM